MKLIETDDYKLTYDDSPEAKDRVFESLLNAFLKLQSFSGESLQQSDSTWEEAPDILTEVAEQGFKFQMDWKE